jgi:hypothetical protein
MKQWSLDARSKDQSDYSLSLWKGRREKLRVMLRQTSPSVLPGAIVLAETPRLPIAFNWMRTTTWPLPFLL